MGLDRLTRIVDDAGALRAVGYFFDPVEPERIAAVRLMFVGGDFVVGVDANDATVTLDETTDEMFARWKMFDASRTPPWDHAIGKSVLWARLVEDQHGAPDAIQLELTVPWDESVVDDTITVQLMTGDISLTVQTLTDVPTPDMRA